MTSIYTVLTNVWLRELASGLVISYFKHNINTHVQRRVCPSSRYHAFGHVKSTLRFGSVTSNQKYSYVHREVYTLHYHNIEGEHRKQWSTLPKSRGFHSLKQSLRWNCHSPLWGDVNLIDICPNSPPRCKYSLLSFATADSKRFYFKDLCARSWLVLHKFKLLAHKTIPNKATTTYLYFPDL